MDTSVPEVGICAVRRSRFGAPQEYADVVVRGDPCDQVHLLIACVVIGRLAVRHERSADPTTLPIASHRPITVILVGDRRPHADTLTVVHHAIQAWRHLLESAGKMEPPAARLLGELIPAARQGSDHLRGVV